MSIHFILKDKIIEVECYQKLNLLAHAQLEELDIGSSCGGHGICGADKIQLDFVMGDLSEPTEAEREHLTDEEIKAGWRLGCQCWPMSDHQQIKVRRG